MNDLDYLELDPLAVLQAGRRTDGTAGGWETWAGRIRITCEYADVALRSAKIYAALTEYAVGVVAGADRVGQQVSNLGVDTVSAGTVVEQSDGEAVAVLNRPVNVPAHPSIHSFGCS